MHVCTCVRVSVRVLSVCIVLVLVLVLVCVVLCRVRVGVRCLSCRAVVKVFFLRVCFLFGSTAVTSIRPDSFLPQVGGEQNRHPWPKQQ